MRRVLLFVGLVLGMHATAHGSNPVYDPHWATNDTWQVLCRLQKHPAASTVCVTNFYSVERIDSVSNTASVLVTEYPGSRPNTGWVDEYHLLFILTNMVLSRIDSSEIYLSEGEIEKQSDSNVSNPYGVDSWFCGGADSSDFAKFPDACVPETRMIRKPWEPGIGTTLRSGFMIPQVNRDGEFTQTITFSSNTMDICMVQSIATTTQQVMFSWQAGDKWWKEFVSVLSCPDCVLTQMHAYLDRDLDGMGDVWEMSIGLNPGDPSDGLGDMDADGLSNALEFSRGTDPVRSDTDGDGFDDGTECAIGTDPLSALEYPVNVAGTVSYVGSQTGRVFVVATTNQSSWGGEEVWADASGGFVISNLFSSKEWYFKAYKDSHSNECNDNLYLYLNDEKYVAEPWGSYTSSPVTLNSNRADIMISLQDPFCVSGVVTYAGSSTGRTYVVTVPLGGTNFYQPSIDSGFSIAVENGQYQIPGVLAGRQYLIQAFRDTNGNYSFDPGEPKGDYPGNPLLVTNNVGGINVELLVP